MEYEWETRQIKKERWRVQEEGERWKMEDDSSLLHIVLEGGVSKQRQRWRGGRW